VDTFVSFPKIAPRVPLKFGYHVTNCIPGKQHNRTKPSKRVRTRTRTVRRGEKWEGEKEFRRLQRYQATLRTGGEPSDWEFGEGEVEGAGFSEESGVETEEEYEVELGEGEPSEEEEEKEEDEEEDEGGGWGGGDEMDWEGDGGDFGGGRGGGAVGQEIAVF
jgi:hypothetical protein